MSHHKKKPANVSPPVWDISQEICFPALNRSCSVEVLPCVPEHDVEDLSESVKENNAENVTDMTPITPSARLTSHKSLDNDSPTAHGECDDVILRCGTMRSCILFRSRVQSTSWLLSN